MQGMFLSLISGNIFCVITSRRESKRSRPDLFNVWLYERAKYSNLKQCVWARSISWDNFSVRPGCQTAHAYLRTKRMTEQTHKMSHVGTPDRTK